MEKFETLMNIMSSPLFDYIVKGFLIYMGLLWLALVIWVARDIVNRSNNIFMQVLYILMNLLLPIFGLILYLVLRPQRTLLERYYDDVEHEFFEEFQQQSDEKEEKKSPHKASKKIFKKVNKKDIPAKKKKTSPQKKS